jgi:hypothetical protein
VYSCIDVGFSVSADLFERQQSILSDEVYGLIGLSEVGRNVQYVIPSCCHHPVFDLFQENFEISRLTIKLDVESLDCGLIELGSGPGGVIDDSVFDKRWSKSKIHWDLLCHLSDSRTLAKGLVFDVATLIGVFLRLGLGEELIFEVKEASLLPLFLRCAEEACDDSTYGLTNR